MIKQRPIIFNTEMVQAIVDGRKTQTRRQMNPQPKPDTETSQGGYWFPCAAFQSMAHVEDFQHPFSRGMASDACPICSVGDQLYVRETFCIGKYEAEDRSPEHGGEMLYISQCTSDSNVIFKQHALEIGCSILDATWKPSIHMPRSCARILLEVTAVRVERLNDISDQDAKAEGITFTDYGQNKFGNQQPGWLWRKSNTHEECLSSAKWAFANLWNSIYENWDINPWVWVIEFKVISVKG